MRGASWAAICLGLLLAAGGCSGGGAAELLATAQLEEVQNSPERARRLYTEIVERHPDSPEAAKARERLAALDANPPPPEPGS